MNMNIKRAKHIRFIMLLIGFLTLFYPTDAKFYSDTRNKRRNLGVSYKIEISNINVSGLKNKNTHLIKLITPGMTANLSNISLSNITNQSGPSTILITKGMNVSISNSSFISNSGKNARDIEISNIKDLNLSFDNTNFDGTLAQQTLAQQPSVYLLATTNCNITFNKCNFTNYATSGKGSALYAKQMIQTIKTDDTYSLNVYSSNFVNNSAIIGGVVNIEFHSYAVFVSCLFENNSATNSLVARRNLENTSSHSRRILSKMKRYLDENLNQAGVMQIANYANVYAQNCIFRNNTANQFGVFQVIIRSSLKVVDCLIESNNAMLESSIGVFIDSINNVFNNTQIKKNSVNGEKGKGIYLVKSDIQFVNCTLEDNISIQNYKNIYAILSSINFENSNFKDRVLSDNLTADDYNTIINQNGGFIYIVQSSMNVSNSNFTNGIANNGGSIFSTIDSILKIDNSSFLNSKSLEIGGGVFSSFSKSVSVTNSQFSNNYSPVGDAIYLDSTTENTTISKSTFVSSNPPNFINFQKCNVFVDECTFKQTST